MEDPIHPLHPSLGCGCSHPGVQPLEIGAGPAHSEGVQSRTILRHDAHIRAAREEVTLRGSLMWYQTQSAVVAASLHTNIQTDNELDMSAAKNNLFTTATPCFYHT